MPPDRNGDKIAAVMRPFYIFLLKRGVDDAAEELAIELGFDVENEGVQLVLDQLATMIRGVANTTKEDVRRLVGQAAEQGWAPSELADKIREYGVTASKTRAEMISRTETARGYVAGNILAYRESGQVAALEWLVSEPCEICAPLAGKRVPLGEAFADGIMHPPDPHPACKCDVAPILTEA